MTAAMGCVDEDVRRKAPALTFESTTFDFGSVPAGEVVRHDFAFSNAGDFDLSIDTVKPGCNCTVALTPGTVIPPGTRGSVAVSLDTAAEFGAQRRTVAVYANDPQHRVSTLRLTGDVIADVVAKPARLYIGHVQRGAAVGQEITVLAAGDTTQLATDPTTSFFNLRSSPLADGRTGQTVTLNVRDDADPGPIDDVVKVRTTNPRAPLVEIPVTGVIDPDLIASPERLEFADVVAGSSPSLGLLIDNGTANRVNVTGVGWPVQLGRAEVQTVRNGFRYRVVVTLSSQLAPGKIDAVLEVHTDHPEIATIQVPVTAFVRRPG